MSVSKVRLFGPQPFLAIEKKDGEFVHDNFDFDLKPQIWHYAFHDDTLPLDKVKSIGVASNDIYGNTDIVKLDLARLMKKIAIITDIGFQKKNLINFL